jgi:hypothetical protein
MAVNVSVFDLDNYPNNSKTVTVDLSELVPYGSGGEDFWVLSSRTSATASGGATIQRLYINDTKLGWLKASGLNAGPYSVTGAMQHLTVSIDEAIGSGVEIELTDNVLSLGGDTVAADLQIKIQALGKIGGAKEGNLSYLNACVTFVNGRFKVVSGTVSSEYIGANRSSVAITDGTTTTGLAAELGFDIPFTSETLAGTPVVQTSVSSAYTAPSTTLLVTTAGVVSEGDCIAVSDGTNKEFRGVESSIGNTVTLSSGFTNSYAGDSLLQVLDVRDPSGEPPPAYAKIDDYVKFSIASMVNQIDFSS